MTDECFSRRTTPHEKFGRFDVVWQTLARLDALAESPSWYTAAFVDADIVLDKGGVADALRKIVDRAGEIAYERVPQEYDAYLNYWVRSLKAWRKGDELGGRLHAAASTLPLVNLLFGLERRWPPYLDRLESRLSALEAAQGWEPGELRAALLGLLDDGGPARQRCCVRAASSTSGAEISSR